MLLRMIAFVVRLKLFPKIFLVNAIILIAAIIALLLFVSNSVTSMLIDKEIKYNQLVLFNMSAYMDDKIAHILQITKKSYFPDFSYSRPLEFLEDTSSASDTGVLERYNRFSSYFESAVGNDRDISGILIYKKVDNSIYLFSKYTRQFYNSALSVDPDKLIEVDKHSTLTKTFSAYKPFYANINAYSFSINLNNVDTLKPIGIMIIDFDTEGIRKALSQYYEDVIGDILVMTKAGDIIYDSSNTYYGGRYPNMDLLNKNVAVTKMEGKDSLLNLTRNESTDIIIAGIIPKSALLAKIKKTRQTIIIISATFMLIALLLTYLSNSLFSKRIKSVITSMRKVREGNLSHRIPLTASKDEIDEISNTFNKLCRDLEQYISKVYVSEIKQKNAQLLALQSQINPHFLYNTLEAIRMRSITEGATESGKMLLILAKLFRNTVKEDAIITIQDEIKHVQLYLDLFQIRYQNRLSVEYHIDPEILHYAMLRHLLQPILENYIIHGYQSSSNLNLLKIKGYKAGLYICFEIQDNGLGIAPLQLKQIQDGLHSTTSHSKTSIGISNVNERIQIIYGETCGIEIESELNLGTMVQIRILAKTKEEYDNYV